LLLPLWRLLSTLLLLPWLYLLTQQLRFWRLPQLHKVSSG
jgi:hypothetical protein